MIRTEFDSQEAGALAVVAADTSTPAPARARDRAIDAYATDALEARRRRPGRRRHRRLPRRPARSRSAATLTDRFAAPTTAPACRSCPSVEPVSSPPASSSSHDIRATPTRRSPVKVTGAVGPARRHQGRRCSAGCRWPPAIIAVITFVLLFLMFGSVVVPAQGARAQRAEPHARRSGRWSGSSRTATCRACSTSPPPGTHRRHHADPHVLRRLRPVDGLRGVPPLPHQGGARPQAPTTSTSVARRPRAHRPHRHRGRAADRRRVHSPSPRRRSASSSCSASGSRWPS